MYKCRENLTKKMKTLDPGLFSLHISCTDGQFSGVATPGHTRACAHVKFAGARVKIMWKAKVKGQLLACAIASFMWT